MATVCQPLLIVNPRDRSMLHVLVVTDRARSLSWVTMRNAPGYSRSADSRRSTDGKSRWFVGSSRKSTSGSAARAAPICQRFRSPGEPVDGRSEIVNALLTQDRCGPRWYERDRSGVRRMLSGEERQQRRLPGSVRSDEAGPPRTEVEGRFVDDRDGGCVRVGEVRDVDGRQGNSLGGTGR